MMCPNKKATTVAGRYDQALTYARDQHLPLDAPRPLPTSCWPRENIALLERYRDWLLGGGACEHSTDIIYMPIAGHVLGLNIKPHEQIDLEHDLDRTLEYVRAKKAGKDWLKASRNGVNKFRRFLRLERGLGEVQKVKPFDIVRQTEGLPAWLVSELERYQHLRQRNWRDGRVEKNIRAFWSISLRIWRFLCEQRSVREFADLKRQHILDYLDHRLGAGFAASGVNTDLHYFQAFLGFLQDEGYVVPQALLRIPGLKPPDSLPRHLTDEQVRRLRDDLEGRVAQAALSNHRRDALLDRAVFYLLWQSALRLGEVEELRLEDLDLEGRRLTVRDGKNRKDRTVYLTDASVQTLREYLEVRGEGSGDHVFLYRNAPLKKNLVSCRLKAAGERVGLKLYAHRLRHTGATQLLNAGCRVTSIQRLLGHKKLNTTMIYARIHDKAVAEDYYQAMAKVEQGMILVQNWPMRKSSIEEMLKLVNELSDTALDARQIEMVSALRSGLASLTKSDCGDRVDVRILERNS